jgi:hypothetical protein
MGGRGADLDGARIDADIENGWKYGGISAGFTPDLMGIVESVERLPVWRRPRL